MHLKPKLINIIFVLFFRKQLYTFYRQDSQEASKVCPKPGEPLQEDIHYAEMTDCEFMGSERMEFLLQALHHEQDSGRSFRKYIHKSERMVI